MKRTKKENRRASYGRSTLVFVGPTLSARDAFEVLPAADVQPPAAVGDILRAAHDKQVRRIALIDGYFERMAAVWHKEILVAIERGIEVWGAASMGALRAAELHPFGMRGVGQIFKQYKRNAITADDEVAIAHLPLEGGYRAVSDALVNIRATLRQLVADRTIKRETETRLVELAQARFYRERTWATLCADGRAAKLAEREVAAVESALKLDQKALDARQLLAQLARTPIRRPAKLRVPRTWALRQLETLVLRQSR